MTHITPDERTVNHWENRSRAALPICSSLPSQPERLHERVAAANQDDHAAIGIGADRVKQVDELRTSEDRLRRCGQRLIYPGGSRSRWDIFKQRSETFRHGRVRENGVAQRLIRKFG